MSDIQDSQKVEIDEKYCSSCGAIIKKEAVICPKCGVQQKAMDGDGVSNNWLTVLLLCLFLGGIGAHDFYVGKKNKGILLLVLIVGGAISGVMTMGIGFVAVGVGCVLWLIDLINILTERFKDGTGNIIRRKSK